MSISIDSNSTIAVQDSVDTKPTSQEALEPVSTGKSVLEAIKQLPGWKGDDFEDVLRDVYATRSRF